MSYKSFSFLKALSRSGHVNLSTPSIFQQYQSAETVIDLIFDWQFNQKWLQESLFAP